MLRRALLVGIDDYPLAPLSGCVMDAVRIQSLLARNEDQSPNFDCRSLLVPRGGGSGLRRAELREALREHFAGEADLALLHFSGHGYIDELGGYLMTTDASSYDEGIPMRELIEMANKSPIPEVVIVLDCCHSGSLGEPSSSLERHALLREGVSVLTASGPSQPSLELDGGGLFSSLLCSALSGQAADLFGNVTVASIYAHIDPYLGAWSQRPRFRANVRRLTPLRLCAPPVDFALLRELPRYFASAEAAHALDPSYEPSAPPHHREHEQIFAKLQRLAQRGLVEPVAHSHMYYAAMEGGACRLTLFGRHCWMLASHGRL